MIARLLPAPLVSAALFCLWLLLNQTIAPGPALVGLVVALLGGWMLSALQPARQRRPGALRRARLLLVLLGHAAYDIIRSNIGVAQVILRRRSARRAGFLHMPLRLRDPGALAMLACILTATPGSAWIEFDPADGMLLLHVLDLVDEEAWIALVKHRYETPLLEIFG